MTQNQLSLLGAGPELPEGFKYQGEVISPDEEQGLLRRRVKELPLRGFQFQGYVGKRRVVSCGWQYDFNERKLRQAEDITDRVGAQHSWGGRASLLHHVS